MLFVPLPFVVAFLLLILLVQMIRRNDGNAPNPFFTALIAVYVLQSVVIGVRWGYGVLRILPFQAVLAAIVPSLAWLSFEGLRDGRSPLKRPLLWCTDFQRCSSWGSLPSGPHLFPLPLF